MSKSPMMMGNHRRKNLVSVNEMVGYSVEQWNTQSIKMVMIEMIKQDYYTTDKQGNCVNYGFNCFNCSHWYGYFDNGGCDMVKTTFTTTINSGDVE